MIGGLTVMWSGRFLSGMVAAFLVVAVVWALVLELR